MNVPVIIGADLAGAYEVSFALEECSYRHELLDTAGDRHALVRTNARFRDGHTGPAEVECLQVVGVDATGAIVRLVGFDADDVVSARAELDATRRGAPTTLTDP